MEKVNRTDLKLIIRKAKPSDAKALLEYIEGVAKDSENLTFGPGEFGLSLEQEEQFLNNQAQRSNALYLLAVMDGQIVGNLSFTAGHRPRTLHVGDMGITVAKAWWGHGIASRLIEELLRWSRQEGIRKINLKVRVDNEPAIGLYQKMGFQTEGVITRDLNIRGELIDVYQMGLCID